jgi:hypothetical protein
VITLTNIDVSIEKIYVVFRPCFDKNGWKYKAQTNVEFQGVIKSIYTQFFRKAHILNDILFLEFAHVVVVENKDIRVNWDAYVYLAYRRQRSLEMARKT